MINQFTAAREIHDSLPELLDKIEECIKEDPNHLYSYLAIKRALEEADGLLYYCMYE